MVNYNILKIAMRRKMIDVVRRSVLYVLGKPILKKNLGTCLEKYPRAKQRLRSIVISRQVMPRSATFELIMTQSASAVMNTTTQYNSFSDGISDVAGGKKTPLEKYFNHYIGNSE